MEGKLHPDLRNDLASRRSDVDWGAGEGLQDPFHMKNHR